jgi:hypothetical protein
MARLLSPFSPSMALLLGCFALVLPPCSNGHASPKVDPNIRQKACDGQLVGPNSTVGNFGMQLGSDWAIITPQGDTSGLEGCFFRVDTSVGKTILTNCVVGHRCLAVGGVQGCSRGNRKYPWRTCSGRINSGHHRSGYHHNRGASDEEL